MKLDYNLDSNRPIKAHDLENLIMAHNLLLIGLGFHTLVVQLYKILFG
jgi:hypothetical protein